MNIEYTKMSDNNKSERVTHIREILMKLILIVPGLVITIILGVFAKQIQENQQIILESILVSNNNTNNILIALRDLQIGSANSQFEVLSSINKITYDNLINQSNYNKLISLHNAIISATVVSPDCSFYTPALSDRALNSLILIKACDSFGVTNWLYIGNNILPNLQNITINFNLTHYCVRCFVNTTVTGLIRGYFESLGNVCGFTMYAYRL